MRVLVLALLFTSTYLFSVELPVDESGMVSYTAVSEVKDAKSKDIYSALKVFISKNFKSSKAVIDSEDKDTGIIEGNAIMPIRGDMSEGATLYGDMGEVTFKMSFRVKDGKYKCTFYNFVHKWEVGTSRANWGGGPLERDTPQFGGVFGMPNTTWYNIRQKLDANIKDLGENLKTSIPVEIKKNADF